jgi:conjugal transfer pilus assembly protein TraV
MKRSLLASLYLSLFLVGCSHTQEEFDCPASKGIGCQSVTEVKKKLNQGEIDMPETTTEAYRRRGGHVSFTPPVMSQAPVQSGLTPIAFMDSNGMVIQRTPEKPLRVWIAPYQDQEGNLRESSVIHTVIQGGTWHMSPSLVS